MISVGALDDIPIPNVDIILGNDVCGNAVLPNTDGPEHKDIPTKNTTMKDEATYYVETKYFHNKDKYRPQDINQDISENDSLRDSQTKLETTYFFNATHDRGMTNVISEDDVITPKLKGRCHSHSKVKSLPLSDSPLPTNKNWDLHSNACETEYSHIDTANQSGKNGTNKIVVVTTRAGAKKAATTSENMSLDDCFLFQELPKDINENTFVEQQKLDVSLKRFREMVVPPSQLDNQKLAFYFSKNGVLLRKMVFKHNTIHQVVVPVGLRNKLMGLAHNLTPSSHLGRNKSFDLLRQHYYWPKMYSHLRDYIKRCHICQVMGKPNQVIPKSPLKPIKVVHNPFEYIVIDIVGPLPKTKGGSQYMLTIMCQTSRFPEAIALKNTRAKTIVKALVKFFTYFGFPKTIQSDNGSNFRSTTFKNFCSNIAAEHKFSSICHPESQGCLERFHQTLKSMLKKFSIEHNREWDINLPLLLFTVRNTMQESLGFSPADIVFGKSLRNPLNMVKDKLCSVEESPEPIDKYVRDLRNNLQEIQSFAMENLRAAQDCMKDRFDIKAKSRKFEVGDQVLVYFPNNSNPWSIRYSGPYTIHKKLSDTNYVVKTPNKRKKFYNLNSNLFKKYFPSIENDNNVSAVSFIAEGSPWNQHQPPTSSPMSRDSPKSTPHRTPASSSSVYVLSPNNKFVNPQQDSEKTPAQLQNLRTLLVDDVDMSHLDEDQQTQVIELLLETPRVVDGVLRGTNVEVHDVILKDPEPVKSHYYKLPPPKLRALREEISKLLQDGVIQESSSSYSSPCFLINKKDGSYRMVIDYRKVNKKIVDDFFPIPDINSIIQDVASANYISVVDMQSGFYQCNNTPLATRVSAFITEDGLYEFTRMPFGIKNAPATFSRMVEKIFRHHKASIRCYIDDIVVYSGSWREHLHHLRTVFGILDESSLSVNLKKLQIGNGTVTYLGHQIGSGLVAPVQSKIQGIVDYNIPRNRRELQRFLGMAGYYRRFCERFSDLAKPLTDLLKGGVRFAWSEDCQRAFEALKAMLGSSPVLRAPDFYRPFVLTIDASAFAMGAVLFQEHNNDLMPISYFSRKFSETQLGYSTIERELLALVEACSHFQVFLKAGFPVKVLTDHNPLVHLTRLKHTNQRLLRWSVRLQDYPLEIEHIKGKHNIMADAMSRSIGSLYQSALSSL